jgi:hypothetical protein
VRSSVQSQAEPPTLLDPDPRGTWQRDERDEARYMKGLLTQEEEDIQAETPAAMEDKE